MRFNQGDDPSQRSLGESGKRQYVQDPVVPHLEFTLRAADQRQNLMRIECEPCRILAKLRERVPMQSLASVGICLAP